MSDARGFSLLEVLVATSILAAALVALSQLFVISTKANGGARATTFATTLAEQKMEQLRGLTWGFDSLGLPLSDVTTDITVVPERITGGTGLQPSPAGSLTSNTQGYCDFLDAGGTSLGTGSTPPAGTVYIRRWSIEPLPTNPNDTLILQVVVIRNNDSAAAGQPDSIGRLPDEARMVSVKTRKAT